MTESWESLRTRATRRLLQMHYEAGVGHLGGNLSCLDILLYLHHYLLKPQDVFILSKGHAAGALYVTLWTLGKMTDAELKTFHQDGGLCGHITAAQGSFATGSLGHGLSLAAGLALANQIHGRQRRVYCLLSDGELQEGSTKEAAAFIRARALAVTMVVDGNGWQGFDKVDRPGADDWMQQASRRGDGHELESLRRLFEVPEKRGPAEPVCVWCQTTKGRGTPYEDTLASHYWPLTQEQYEESLRRLAG